MSLDSNNLKSKVNFILFERSMERYSLLVIVIKKALENIHLDTFHCKKAKCKKGKVYLKSKKKKKTLIKIWFVLLFKGKEKMLFISLAMF